MAKCDEGYLCSICGEEVSRLTDSELYLRYVVGMVAAELLHTTPDRHLRCVPSLSQFIIDDHFEPVFAEGEFDKRLLSPEIRKKRENLFSRGWVRLREIEKSRSSNNLLITDYPLADIREND
ncbi:MAG: hypothetical protein R3C03_19030 [Pirellulaceae bacterium]